MASSTARMKATQAWQTPETENRMMDEKLLEAFADILEKETSIPRLGYATTEELLEEIKARCSVNGTLQYRTIGGGC